MSNCKLGIYGPYPPPIGGVSVHIERLEYYLKTQGIDYTIYNYGSFSNGRIIATNKRILWYFRMLFTKKYSVFHFHLNFLIEIYYYFLFSKINATELIITLHGEKLLKTRNLHRRFLMIVLRQISNCKVIAVSERVHRYLLHNGVESVYLPAYVPPVVVNPVNVQKDGRTLFLFSVWRFNKEAANDIYNVPLAFEFLEKYKTSFKMLFLIGDEQSSDKLYLNKLISTYQIGSDIEIVYNQNLVDYLQNCSFILRTNTIDGYGVSLQEAMDLGVPAVASDVCLRPRGTVIFRSRILEDMVNKILFVLNNEKSELLKDKEELTYHNRIIEMYKSSNAYRAK